MKIDIINACSDLGININGSRYAPPLLVDSIKNKFPINKIYTINADHANKETNYDNKKKNINKINIFNKELYNKVLESKNNNCFPIIIGGDHSISIASSLASIKSEKNLGIIWIDSHADFNTFKTTETGNIHGLPFATITGNNQDGLTLFHDGNFYNSKNAVLIGARDIDTFELPNLLNSNLKVFSTDDLLKNKISSIIKESISIASKNTNGVHISCDVDVLDPLIAPGVSVPAKSGINEQILYSIIENLLLHKDIIKSFDLVEFNPKNDIDNKTKNITLEILKKIITEKM